MLVILVTTFFVTMAVVTKCFLAPRVQRKHVDMCV